MSKPVTHEDLFSFLTKPPLSIAFEKCDIKIEVPDRTRQLLYREAVKYRQGSNQPIAVCPMMLEGLSSWHLKEVRPDEAVTYCLSLGIAIQEYFSAFNIDIDKFLKRGAYTYEYLAILFDTKVRDLMTLRDLITERMRSKRKKK